MKTIILTGNAGSGKTYISKYFRLMYGIPIFNTDNVARTILGHDKVIKKKVIDIFGVEAYKDNVYNRKFIGDIIFNDADKRAAIEKIISAKLRYIFNKFKKEYENNLYCIVECATFFDTAVHTDYKYDYVIGVDADKDIRIERIKARSDWSDEKIENVMKIQTPITKINVDYLIVNNGNKSVEKIINDAHSQIIESQGLEFKEVHIRIIAEDRSLFPYGHCEHPKRCYPCDGQFIRS